jgi:hypothetical protein
MSWTVKYTSVGANGFKKCPKNVQTVMKLLEKDLEASGPVQTSWPHYSKITGHKKCHHCHVFRLKMIYVAVWRESGTNSIEVIYVGSHEKANYGRACKS